LKKNITIYSHSFGRHPSALAVRMNYLYDSLIKLDANVNVIYTCGNSKSPDDILIKNIIVPSNLNIVARVLNELYMGLAIFYRTFRIPNTYCFIITSPPFFTMLLLSFILRIQGKKYWLDIRDPYPQSISDAKIISNKSFLYKLFDLLCKISYEHAIGILVARPSFLNNIHCENTYLFSNGFPKKLFLTRPTKYIKKTVCIHGFFGYFQDTSLILELGDLLKGLNIDLVIIGGGNKFKDLMKLKSKNIKIYNVMPHEKCMSIISRCHIGLSIRTFSNLSLSSLPVKVWEYLGLNIPCIVYPPLKLDPAIKKTNLVYAVNERCKYLILEKINLIFEGYLINSYYKNNISNMNLLQRYTRENLSDQAAKKILKSI